MFETQKWGTDSYLNAEGAEKRLLTLHSAFESAGSIGAKIQLVIPTVDAFSQSAGQALMQGTYGARSEIRADYFDLVTAYLAEAERLAEIYGVEISHVEIGNEYWGSGQMTAREYGFLAARLTEFLGIQFPDYKVLAQIDGKIGQYSPVSETVVYLEPDGNGDFQVHTAAKYDGLPAGWAVGTMPGSGNARTQTETIGQQFNLREGSIESLSGVVEHIYFEDGFDEIDVEKDFALQTIYNAFVETTGAAGIDYFATEWSPRNPRYTDRDANIGNANGLQFAHSAIEAFFELTSNGVGGAQFWPLTFGGKKTNYRVMLDEQQQDVTFSGAVFGWMSETLVGSTPVLDFDLPNEIDIHGYAKTDGFAMFVADRSGNESSIELDVGAFLEPGSHYQVRVSYLYSDDGSFQSDDANPVLREDASVQTASARLKLLLQAWELAKVEFQEITENDDTVVGGSGSDELSGLGGADFLRGLRGDDSLKGGFGADTLVGDDGNDTLKGGGNQDLLIGGAGQDVAYGGPDRDSLFGQAGDDLLWGEDDDDWIATGAGRDQAFGGSGNDTIWVSGNENLIEAGDGDDVIAVTGQAIARLGYGSGAAGFFSAIGAVDVQGAGDLQFAYNVIDGGDGRTP